jgi:hypothetical protein
MSITSPIVVPTQSVTETSVITAQEVKDQEILKKQGEAIDVLFEKREAPLEGHGLKFAEEAKEHGLDWRLLPAIAIRESGGGKQACKKVPNSVFGYGSCKIGFESIDKSIEVVAASLGGDDPQTAYHYDGKTTEQILKKYNSVVPNYSKQVEKIMKMIDIDGVV